MKGGQEQHVPHQVVLELVVADEGCEGTQAELQGEDHFGGGPSQVVGEAMADQSGP